MKTNNLLAVDIGNTTISFALFRNSRILASDHVDNGDIPALSRILRKWGVKNPFSIIISSVVPQKTAILKKSLKRTYKEIKIWEVGQNLHPKVKMRYKASNLGADRLVNVYGVVQKYRLPALVIDFGTAITFDYVDRKGVFLGGLIVPGMDISWQALQNRAFLLPQLRKLKQLHPLAATDTPSAMYSGLLNGFGALTDGLIGRFKEKYGLKLTVLATGGASPIIAKYAKNLDQVDPLHTLKSLNLIYQDFAI